MIKSAQAKKILGKLHSFEGKLAQYITEFAGSMLFVYIHMFWFGLWILINLGYFKPMIMPFDRFPYGLLTLVVSLEAIFLSTFIMIAHNQQVLIDQYREIEEEIEEKEEDKEIDDIQKDLDDIKTAISSIQGKITNISGNVKNS
jgi:uncharacterized membrane protein